jgi:hypothetical protein
MSISLRLDSSPVSNNTKSKKEVGVIRVFCGEPEILDDQHVTSALSHKKFRVDAPHSMGRYKEETGGLLSQVEDF